MLCKTITPKRSQTLPCSAGGQSGCLLWLNPHTAVVRGGGGEGWRVSDMSPGLLVQDHSAIISL